MKRRTERAPLLALALLAALPWAAADAGPAPFRATYTVEWRGLSAGTSTLELEETGDGMYVYTSRNVARGIFRLAIPDAITQASTFTVREGSVVPLFYRADDGSKDTARDVTLDFDWQAMRVTGVAENERVELPLRPGAQDPLSVQIALMRALEAGSVPASFWMIDKDELKEYSYRREREERIETPLGPLDTIVYTSSREGSSRVTRLWLAPSLGFLPARAEQLRRGKSEFRMTIRSLQRTAPDPQPAGER